MKAIIILLVVGVLGFVSYTYFDRFMVSENFESDVEGIIQIDAPNEEAIRKEMLKKAEERGVIINPDEIFISIEDTEEKTIAGSIVGRGGMKVETKKLTVRFPYTVKSLGLSKAYHMERFRLFTARVKMPEPNIPE